MLNKKSVDDINVKGKRVLVRCEVEGHAVLGRHDQTATPWLTKLNR